MMKKLIAFNIILSIFILLVVLIPYTRIYMIGNLLGDMTTLSISLVLFVSSILSYKKNSLKINFITLFISLTPILFSLILLILIYLKVIPFAP